MAAHSSHFLTVVQRDSVMYGYFDALLCNVDGKQWGRLPRALDAGADRGRSAWRARQTRRAPRVAASVYVRGGPYGLWCYVPAQLRYDAAGVPAGPGHLCGDHHAGGGPPFPVCVPWR